MTWTLLNEGKNVAIYLKVGATVEVILLACPISYMVKSAFNHVHSLPRKRIGASQTFPLLSL